MTRRAVKPRTRLTASDWADAALIALGRHGLAGLAIEPLAVSLGATKGSFYWHFANRDALLQAALERWQTHHTEAIIALVQTKAAPLDQLRRLLATVIESTAESQADSIELAILASSDNPLVAAALGAVTRRRVDFTTNLFTDLGFAPEPARQRALMAFTAYLGHAQLARSYPGVLPATVRARADYVEQLVQLLTAELTR